MALGVAPARCQADENIAYPRAHHPWMRFAPGTTRHERITTQTYGPDGELQSTSITEQRTTLLGVTTDTYTLQTDTTVELAGKKVQSSNTLEHGLLTDPEEQATIAELEPERIEIQNRTIPCRVLQIEGTTDLQRSVRKLHVANVAPYILRMHTAVGTVSDEELSKQITEEVIALEMPYKVLTEIKPTALRRAMRRHAKGASYRTSVITPDIPGGVVLESTKELDSNGRLLRRSVLELVDYQLQ